MARAGRRSSKLSFEQSARKEMQVKNFFIGLMLLLSAPTLTSAQNFDVSVSGSALVTNSSTHNGVQRDIGATGGVLFSAGWWVSPKNGFVFNYAHANDTQKVIVNGLKQSLDSGMHEVTGAYEYRFNLGGLQPFVSGGGGMLQFNPSKSASLSPTPKSQNKPTLLYGVGVDYFATEHFGVQFQLRGLVYAAPSFSSEAFRTNTMHNTLEPTVGLVLRF